MHRGCTNMRPAVSRKAGFAHGEAFGAPAVSRKAGFAHGEPFGAPAVSGKGGFAHGEPYGAPHGEQKNQICSQQDGNPSDNRAHQRRAGGRERCDRQRRPPGAECRAARPPGQLRQQRG